MVTREFVNDSKFNGFPNQRTTYAERKKEYGSLEKWAIAMIQAIEEIAFYNGTHNVARVNHKSKMQINLDLVEQGLFDPTQFNDLVKPYGDKSDYRFPVTLSHYDIISSKLELLRGEEISRPFNYVVINKTSDNASRLQEKKANIMRQFVLQEFLEEMQKQVGPEIVSASKGPGYPQDASGQPMQTPEALQKYAKYTISDMTEKISSDILQYVYKQENLFYKFNKNFQRFLATGHQYYYIGTYHGEPTVRIIDPRMFDCDMSDESEFLEDPSWCREVRYITAAQVHDELWDTLEHDDVGEIEQMKGNKANLAFLNDVSYLTMYGSVGRSTTVRVSNFEWKSLKKIGIVERMNELGEPEKDVVEESYVKKANETVDWYWITERWEGIKIGENVYVQMRPIPNQYNDLSNLSGTQSRYKGVKVAYCLLDKITQYQYLYNVTMYLLKLAFARAKGKGFVMDIAQIPKKYGWTPDKWLYYLDVFGIAMINSTEGRDSGNPTTFNQFQTFDLTIGNTIQSYIAQLELLKNEVAEVTGVSRQREGQITSSETVGGVERSVNQSAAITESLFFYHSECKRRVFEAVINECKRHWDEGKKIGLVLDDLSRKFIEITDDFKIGDYGVFVSNTSNDTKILQSFKEMAQVSLQQKEITLADYIKAVKTQSISEMEHLLEDATENNMQRQQAMQEQQGQIQQQQMQMQLQMQQQMEQMKAQFNAEALKAKAEVEGEWQLRLQESKNQNNIEVAKIAAEAKIESLRDDISADANKNGILDVLEREKINFEREKLHLETGIAQEELKMKKYEIDTKAKTEEKKAKESSKKSE